MKNFEAILDQVGTFGWYQKKIYALVFVAGIPNAFCTLHFIFSNYVPDFRCKFPEPVQKQLNQNLSIYDELLNLTIPMEVDQFGDLRRSQCLIYDRNYTEIFASNLSLIPTNTSTIDCMDGYDYYLQPYQSSAVTDFNLVCKDSWKTAFIISMMSIGLALGSTMGIISDKYGRRPVFLAGTFFQLFALGISGLSWDYMSYAVITLVSGCSNLVNFVAGFVLATEVTGTEKRNFIAVSNFLSYGIGYLIMSGVSYFVQIWRWNLFTLAISGTLMQIAYYWLLPESTRWLIVSGKMDEAKKELTVMAKMNGKKINVDEIFELLVGKDGKLLNSDSDHEIPQKQNQMINLLRDPTTRGRYYTIFYGWIVTSMVYFGITLHSTEFHPDRFLNSLFQGVIELFGYFASYFLVKYLGRPRSMSLCMNIFGVTCFMLCLFPRDWLVAKSAVALVGKACGSALFYIVYIIASEIPPTMERNTTVGIASGCARLGSFTAPYLMHIGSVSYETPYAIMGVMGIASGLSSYIFIPETKGVEMPDSIEGVKQNTRFYGWKFWKNKFGSRDQKMLQKLRRDSETKI